MRKLEIQYDLKPNGAVIRINNYKGCIFRICRIPKELVFDENGNVREFIDLAYPQPEVIKQSKIPDQDKWTYPETEIINENSDNIDTMVGESIDTNDFHEKLIKVLKENPELKSTDGNTKIIFNQDVIDHIEKPVVNEVFTDNGEHSHWNLIDVETGENLWSEFPEEDLARGFPVKSLEHEDERLKINNANIEKILGRKYYSSYIQKITWEEND
jgi:hypothetical protein